MTRLNQDNEPDEFVKYVLPPREDPVPLSDALPNQSLPFPGDTTARDFPEVARLNRASIRLVDGTILKGDAAGDYLRSTEYEPGSATVYAPESAEGAEPVTSYETTDPRPNDSILGAATSSNTESSSPSAPSTTTSSSMMPDLSGGVVGFVVLLIGVAVAVFGGGD